MKHLERLNEVHRLLREANIEHEKHLELLDNVALLVQMNKTNLTYKVFNFSNYINLTFSWGNWLREHDLRFRN